ncbi:MAG: hypothetical protein E7E92_08675 [Clostridiales bacterium]|nr:hypothetical protein [Clostridiales bacterium]
MGKFPVLNTDEYSILTEYSKLTEEVQEFIGATNKENLVEEFFDVIQVLVNIMDKNNLLDALPEGLDKHINKMEARDWFIKNWLGGE